MVEKQVQVKLKGLILIHSRLDESTLCIVDNNPNHDDNNIDIQCTPHSIDLNQRNLDYIDDNSGNNNKHVAIMTTTLTAGGLWKWNKQKHLLCSYVFRFVGERCTLQQKMWRSFSSHTSVLTKVTTFLPLCDVGRCRQLSRMSKGDIHGWREAVLSQEQVVACQKCPALCRRQQTEHCPLCESTVCVEHLERCGECWQIFCSECVGYCCL